VPLPGAVLRRRSRPRPSRHTQLTDSDQRSVAKRRRRRAMCERDRTPRERRRGWRGRRARGPSVRGGRAEVATAPTAHTSALRCEPEPRGALPRAGLGHRCPCPALEREADTAEAAGTQPAQQRHQQQPGLGPETLAIPACTARGAFIRWILPRPATKGEKRAVTIVRGWCTQ
jgi:hypothetical protein